MEQFKTVFLELQLIAKCFLQYYATVKAMSIVERQLSMKKLNALCQGLVDTRIASSYMHIINYQLVVGGLVSREVVAVSIFGISLKVFCDIY